MQFSNHNFRAIEQSFLAARNPPYFYFRSAWPISKCRSHVTPAKKKISTKFKAHTTIRYQVILLPIHHVTLWPRRLTFWPWTVVKKFLSSPTLSILRWPVMFTIWMLLVIQVIPYRQPRMRSITWPICKVLVVMTFLESLTPIGLFTLQLVWRHDAD